MKISKLTIIVCFTLLALAYVDYMLFTNTMKIVKSAVDKSNSITIGLSIIGMGVLNTLFGYVIGHDFKDGNEE